MKKALLSLLLTFGLCTNVLAFSDVPSEAWFTPYVSDLQEAGVIDAGDFFRPADSLNRAELVKMVIEATGGLENYEAPPHETFDDVPSSAWFAPYIETAATLGIVAGYKDETDSLTGLFGPADIVTRAAAAKILVEAFELDGVQGSTPSFPDVSSADWFYGYVVTAFQSGLVAGYDNGKFGPNDPVTRAQIAKMLSLALNPSEVVDDEEEDADEATEEDTGTDETTDEVADETGDETTEESSNGTPAQANDSPLVSQTLSSGASEVFVANYNFKGQYEGFYVTTLTIVNDTVGSKIGDNPSGTSAIKNVIIKYANDKGELVTAKRSLQSDGKARFSGLDFFVPRDEDSFLEVYADLSSFADVGTTLSGKIFRLGLQDIGNDTQTFRAVGAITNTEVTFGKGALFNTNSDIATFTVRRSAPALTLESIPTILISGNPKLIEFSLSANGGSIGLGRLVLNISVDDEDAAGLSLSDFKFYRNGTLVSSAMIYDASGARDLSAGGTLINGQSSVIISFNQEEIISSDDTVTYSLKAQVAGSDDGDNVITRFADGDEQTPLSGLTAADNDNTGKIFVVGDATAGIFTGATDFSQSVGVNRNIIWSDQSAQPHQYPSIAAGVVNTGSGSADWSNGYLMGISSLDPVILSN